MVVVRPQSLGNSQVERLLQVKTISLDFFGLQYIVLEKGEGEVHPTATSKVADNESKVADNESKVADKVETKVTVKRVTINGVEYLKSTTGVLYDEKTKEEMGIYDEETKTIKAIEYDDDEEEDEYEYQNRILYITCNVIKTQFFIVYTHFCFLSLISVIDRVAHIVYVGCEYGDHRRHVGGHVGGHVGDISYHIISYHSMISCKLLINNSFLHNIFSNFLIVLI